MYGRDFTAMDLLRALMHHADSLETLKLNYDDDWNKVGWEGVDDAELYFNEDLRKLTHLRKLSVNFSALFGIVVPKTGRYNMDLNHREGPPSIHLPARLPESLEEFEVVSCDERIVPHLQELAEVRGKGHFPKLQRVICKLVEEQTGEDIARVDIPGVEVNYEILNSAMRTNLIYDLRNGEGPNDTSAIFDNQYLLGLYS